MWKKSLKIIILSSFAVIIALILSVQLWSSTDQGKLPSKTAVILHAVNNNLIPLDIEAPAFLASTGSSNPEVVMLRENYETEVSDGHSIDLRVYRYSNVEEAPIILYYHGGAFLEGYGSIDTHENVMRGLAARTGAIVIGVGYRVAPEHIFPAAVEDSYDALLWAYDHAEELGGDPSQLAVIGDSAGGNLAAVVTMMAKDREGPEIAAQILYYPLTTFRDVEFASRTAYDSGYYLLSRQVMLKARDAYTPEEDMWYNPYTSPLEAKDIDGLPPAFIVTAEFDPLRDEGELYGKKLHENGIPVETVRYRGVMHGFVSFYEVMRSGEMAMNHSVRFLGEAFAGEVNEVPEEFEIAVEQPPQGIARIKEEAEAYAIAAFLIGRTTWSQFHNW
ncbi:alpha/beta hydrolase [Bacillus sp. FJAT-44742]|uniref:alpha/beta hydrolase n=1 Tax=Bacillus sp. FJAT-44742 TaxID=2014005 RepID=UPI000C242351|nr:alpha/beta hydrolase [Bacillus sp. FJAT-44742]